MPPPRRRNPPTPHLPRQPGRKRNRRLPQVPLSLSQTPNRRPPLTRPTAARRLRLDPQPRVAGHRRPGRSLAMARSPHRHVRGARSQGIRRTEGPPAAGLDRPQRLPRTSARTPPHHPRSVRTITFRRRGCDRPPVARKRFPPPVPGPSAGRATAWDRESPGVMPGPSPAAGLYQASGPCRQLRTPLDAPFPRAVRPAAGLVRPVAAWRARPNALTSATRPRRCGRSWSRAV